MVNISFDKKFFNIKDTLYCGQVFRFREYKEGYLVFSQDKCAYLFDFDENTVICCNDGDKEYFENYFDLARDYSVIYEKALSLGVDLLTESAEYGKGIRILNQDIMETLFSFIISQNNNIPRIKATIEKMCLTLGDEKTFMGEKYFTFPTVEKLASCPIEQLREFGLGYRAEYILRLAKDIINGLNILEFKNLDTVELKTRLLSIYGVGRKVCDCVSLFGFHKSDSFPVDTWISKVYKEDLGGELTDPIKISDYLVDLFGENSGYIQQYLFYYKREREKLKK